MPDDNEDLPYDEKTKPQRRDALDTFVDVLCALGGFIGDILESLSGLDLSDDD